MRKLLLVSFWISFIAGLLLLVGGIFGLYFTYANVARENITTPPDASIPSKPVRGPLTLKAQADVIRKHTLASTGGKTFAEMPRQIEKLDADGNPVLGADGKSVMVENTARNMWVTATTLTTALNTAIFAYAFSAFLILFGILLLLDSFVVRAMGKRFAE